MTWQIVVAAWGHAMRMPIELAKLACVDEVYAPVRDLVSFRRGATLHRFLPWLGNLALADWPGANPHMWHDVKGVAGVAAIVGGWPPTVVPGRDVERFRHTVDSLGTGGNAPEAEPPCAAGDEIEFTYLAFWRVRGRALWVASGAVGVRIHMLGYDQLIQVPYRFVDRVVEVRAPQYGRRRR